MWLYDIVLEMWKVLTEAAVYMLLGFVIAGLLHAFLSKGRMVQYLSGLGSRSVFLASLVGLPLPLCSCSVLPAAVALRKKGASKGATLSFLISTPETSVTSILLTYALLGPLMAIVRPVAAFVSAVAAGLLDNFVEQRWPTPAQASAGATESGQDSECQCDAEAEAEESRGVSQGLRFAFVDIFDDIIGWLLVGFFVAAVLNVVVPPSVMESVFGPPWQAMLLMLIIGVPLYVCAESSTPIAAAFVLAGVSPGAALVFLLVGPATNIGSLGVLLKVMGRRSVVLYLLAVCVVALLAGASLDFILAGRGITLTERALAEPLMPGWVKVCGSVVFLAMCVLSFRRLRYLDRVLGWLDARLPVPVNRKTAGAAAMVIFVLGYGGSGFFMVQPGEVGVVKRFGGMIGEPRAPGLHYALPWPVDSVDKLSLMNVRRLEFGYAAEASENPFAPPIDSEELIDNPIESWVMLADENIVNVKSITHYGVQEGRELDYLYRNGDVEQLVRCATLGAMRRMLGTAVIDTILTTQRTEAETTITRLIQERFDECDSGIRCFAFRFLDLHAPPSVHAAFRDVASAMEDKETTINRAQTFAAKVVPLARGEAGSTLEMAAAYARRNVDEAQGCAQRFVDRQNEYAKAKDVTKRRLYFELVDSVLPKLKKYIKPPSNTKGEVEIWFVQPALQGALPSGEALGAMPRTSRGGARQ